MPRYKRQDAGTLGQPCCLMAQPAGLACSDVGATGEHTLTCGSSSLD